MPPTLAKSEIEVKIRVPDVAAMRRTLAKAGVALRGRVLEHNTLYDTPASDFRHAGCLLRLREEHPAAAGAIPAGPRRVILTWKSPAAASRRSRYKEKLEQEVIVDHPRDWPSALRALGLRSAFLYEKYRTSYRWGALHLDLDETPVGAFLELEGLPAQIDRAAKILNFAPRDYLRSTYWDLYAADCKRRGRAPKNMIFSR